MKFGYFLNQNNRHLKKPFYEVVKEGRDIAEYCDANGWHSIWTTEHHFGHEGFEVCPNPGLMSVDLAARTKQIRLGQAANIVTFYHPLRLAEDLAMLDHMSGGRLEVAVGRGIYPSETINLNPLADVANQEQNQEIFEESVEIMRRAWSQEYFEFQGKHYQFPHPGVKFDHAMSPPEEEFQDPETKEIRKLALVPRTLQQPTPPMWQVIDSPRSIKFSAQNNLNGMFWIPPTDSMVPRFKMYQEEASKARGDGCALWPWSGFSARYVCNRNHGRGREARQRRYHRLSEMGLPLPGAGQPCFPG